MKTRSLLAIAASTLLAAPLAFAQSGSTSTSDTLGQTTGTGQGTTGTATQQQTQDATGDAAQGANRALTNDRAQSTQGAAEAATHSMATARGVWQTLDTDGDGRISRAEGGVDAQFQSNFEMMDADKDGFVSDAEYRTHARAHHTPTEDGDRMKTQDRRDR